MPATAPVRAPTFRGWKAEALEFFDGLEADNSKAYWQAHKAEYETLVRAPMEALLIELEPEWGEGIFRPYRDVRFSKDKSPYKTFIAAELGGGYVQLTANGLGAGPGCGDGARPASSGTAKPSTPTAPARSWRRSWPPPGRPPSKRREHGALKTAPKGYPKDHPRIELLRYKGLIAWREWPAGAWLGTRRAKDRIEDFFQNARPLNDWLRTNVGPAAATGGR
jgi:uncharacterized protein (DUF2461 family)